MAGNTFMKSHNYSNSWIIFQNAKLLLVFIARLNIDRESVGRLHDRHTGQRSASCRVVILIKISILTLEHVTKVRSEMEVVDGSGLLTDFTCTKIFSMMGSTRIGFWCFFVTPEVSIEHGLGYQVVHMLQVRGGHFPFPQFWKFLRGDESWFWRTFLYWGARQVLSSAS